jgi:hypothetical protein
LKILCFLLTSKFPVLLDHWFLNKYQSLPSFFQNQINCYYSTLRDMKANFYRLSCWYNLQVFPSIILFIQLLILRLLLSYQRILYFQMRVEENLHLMPIIVRRSTPVLCFFWPKNWFYWV